MEPMRLPRFSVGNLEDRRIRVEGVTAHHALHVLRLGVGSEVSLFDERGRQAHARIVAVRGGAFEAERVGAIRDPSGSELRLTIAAAAPKGERADWLVEKCAELGVAALWWLTTRRGVVWPGEGKLERWRRKAAAAARQAGHARVMEIAAPRSIEEIAREPGQGVRVFYGVPTYPAEEQASSGVEGTQAVGSDSARRAPAAGAIRTPSLNAALSEMEESRSASAYLIFIGPEGGFTDEECAAIEGFGGRAVCLGDAVLRVETAAVAAAAVWACWAVGRRSPA